MLNRREKVCIAQGACEGLFNLRACIASRSIDKINHLLLIHFISSCRACVLLSLNCIVVVSVCFAKRSFGARRVFFWRPAR